MRAIIIEDIEEVRKGMMRLVSENCKDIELIGQADSVVSASKLIRNEKPDLLFLDIELPDGTGFDILDLVDIPLRVIFTTASNAYAIRAFEYAAIDYLLKPIDKNALVNAVDRVRKLGPINGEQKEILSTGLNQERLPERIALHTMDKITLIQVSDIIRCTADGNYTNFHLKNKKLILVSKTLKEYDKMLSGSKFVRVHQSHLVNMDAVSEYIKVDGTYLVMSDNSKVPISTRKRSEVLKAFDKL